MSMHGYSLLAAPSSRRFRPRRGLSFVEAMISLSISAMLLSAIAAAFTASAQAVDSNDQFYRCTQAGRVSLNQLLREVRLCQTIQVASDHMDLYTATGSSRTYRFSSDQKQILMVLNDVTNTPSYPLASNVTSCTFQADMAPDPTTHVSRVVRVSCTMTINVGKNTQTVTGSAAPRQALVY